MRNDLQPIRTVAPAIEPVSLAEVKAHLRIEHADEDGMIAIYLSAAVSFLDGWSGILGRCLINQTWRQDFAEFEDRLRLPFVGATDVAVSYRNLAEAAVPLNASDFVLKTDALGAYLDPAPDTDWPATGKTHPPVSVTATYGYGATAASVPADIRSAILVHVGQMYADREGGSMPPNALHALTRKYRRIGI